MCDSYTKTLYSTFFFVFFHLMRRFYTKLVFVIFCGWSVCDVYTELSLIVLCVCVFVRHSKTALDCVCVLMCWLVCYISPIFLPDFFHILARVVIILSRRKNDVLLLLLSWRMNNICARFRTIV